MRAWQGILSFTLCLTSPAALVFAEVCDFTKPLKGAVSSPISEKLAKLMQELARPNSKLEWKKDQFLYKRIRQEESSLYIGVWHQFWVNAPIEKVSNVLDRYADYAKFHDAVVDVQPVGHKIHRGVDTCFQLAWKRKSPFFFIPPITYQLAHAKRQESSSRIWFRHQLIESNSLKQSDGLLLLETHEGGTKISDFDFFLANWGLIGGLASNKIWNDSVRGGLSENLELKAYIENLGWSYDQIKTYVEKVFESKSLIILDDHKI